MPGPLAIGAILAGANALGGFLGNRGKNKQSRSSYNAQRPFLERAEKSRAARARLAGGLSKARGLDGVIGGDLLGALGTPTPIPEYTGGEGGLMELLGSGLQSGASMAALAGLGSNGTGGNAAPSVPGAQNFDEFLGTFGLGDDIGSGLFTGRR